MPRLRAVFLLKQDVVGLVAIEGRVEINQVSTLVLDITPENVQVVAVVQRVGIHTGLLVKLAFFYSCRDFEDCLGAALPWASIYFQQGKFVTYREFSTGGGHLFKSFLVGILILTDLQALNQSFQLITCF